MNQNILIIDDDPDILNLVELYVSSYNFKAFKASCANEALDIIANENIDLILLDVILPDMNGFDLCRKIRDRLNVPIIFVSAKGMDQDIIHGLTIGGDDYIVKPFNSIVLLTKIKALLRRCNEYNSDSQENNTIAFVDMIINLDTCKVKIKGQDIKLTPKEYEILILLMKNRGRIFSIHQIHDTIWGENDCISDNAIMVHIANLRNKIESDPHNPEYIKTVWGFGYKI